MSYLIQINTAKPDAKPVYARRLRLNAEAVHRTSLSNLRFKSGIDPVLTLGTDHFHQAGLINGDNTISPSRLWEHLCALERAAALHDVSFVGLSARQDFLLTGDTKSAKNEIFHAVMGRMLDTEGPVAFSSRYDCSDRERSEIDSALIDLFTHGRRDKWDAKKPLFNALGLRIDLTGAAFHHNRSGNSYDGIELDNTILSDADMFYHSFKNASIRNAVMRRAKMGASDFSWADLSWSDMNGSGLGYSRFIQALLRETNLTETDVCCTDFSGANMTLAVLLKLRNTQNTTFNGADMTWATVQRYLEPALNRSCDVKNTDLINWIQR